MNPYLSPTTMPDGSARRPIVERVPECRPTGLEVETTEDGTFVSSFIDGEYMPYERVALALCRVAVQDWIIELPLIETEPIKWTDGQEAGKYTIWLTNLDADHPSEMQTAPQATQDEAWNAVAQLIADIRGVAP